MDKGRNRCWGCSRDERELEMASSGLQRAHGSWIRADNCGGCSAGDVVTRDGVEQIISCEELKEARLVGCIQRTDNG